VGFYAVGVENAGGQTQDGVHIGGFEQLFADAFAGSAFEEHVIGQDYGGQAGGFEHAPDVLHKVELLVAGGGPEILAVVGEVFFFLFAFGVGKGLAAFLAERRVGQHVIVALRRSRDQGI